MGDRAKHISTKQKLKQHFEKHQPISVTVAISRERDLPKYFFGPFYMCLCMPLDELCVLFSSGNYIGLIENRIQYHSDSNLKTTMGFLHISIKTLLDRYTAITVVCTLYLILSFVSLGLILVYNCKRYSRKRRGVICSISMILSGTTTFLFTLIYLIMYGRYTNSLTVQPFTGAFDFSFPYSPVLCIFGSIMYFVCAGILIKLTIQSKGQFNYEMMVIDISEGGSTYIAKT
ncbi:unnamed protein product [Mytilus edulis]|uniref:Uncharacterized protein n=1 Tax=Mytilus edulis TaxID=6550 RepID=A0A8S3RPZ7_MYTED|nr:unnamed protein product [Mytilus edulis]